MYFNLIHHEIKYIIQNVKHSLFLFIWCDRTEDLRHLGNNIKYVKIHFMIQCELFDFLGRSSECKLSFIASITV